MFFLQKSFYPFFIFTYAYLLLFFVWPFKENVEFVKHEFITGIRRDGQLLYVPSEKHLYVKWADRNGGVDYICYQTILVKNKQQNSGKNIPICTSRMKVTSDGKCRRKKIFHTKHENHEAIYKDLNT